MTAEPTNQLVDLMEALVSKQLHLQEGLTAAVKACQEAERERDEAREQRNRETDELMAITGPGGVVDDLNQKLAAAPTWESFDALMEHRDALLLERQGARQEFIKCWPIGNKTLAELVVRLRKEGGEARRETKAVTDAIETSLAGALGEAWQPDETFASAVERLRRDLAEARAQVGELEKRAAEPVLPIAHARASGYPGGGVRAGLVGEQTESWWSSREDAAKKAAVALAVVEEFDRVAAESASASTLNGRPEVPAPAASKDQPITVPEGTPVVSVVEYLTTLRQAATSGAAQYAKGGIVSTPSTVSPIEGEK